MAGGAGRDDLTGGIPAPTGGLGGLGGIARRARTGGRCGFLSSPGFGDWLSAFGTSLMQSPRNNPMAGFSDALSNRQALRQRQELLAYQRAEKANDRGAMELALVTAGLSLQIKPEPFLATPPPRTWLSSKWRGTSRRRAPTSPAERLRDKHPDLAGAIDDGSMTGVEAATEAYRRDREALKPPSLQEIYTEDGGSQKGYFRDGEWHAVGGAKKPAQSGAGTNAPSGFRFTDETRTSLEPIPGGPGEQIGGENAGRIGIAKKLPWRLASIRQEVAKGGVTGLSTPPWAKPDTASRADCMLA